MNFTPSYLELKARTRQNSRDLLTNLSAEFFTSLMDKKYPENTGKILQSSKVKLSHDFMKHSQVQRIISDLGGRLEDFLNQQFKDNLTYIENFLQDPDLGLSNKTGYSSNEKVKRVVHQRPNSVQPLFSERRMIRTAYGDSGSATNKLSSTAYNHSPNRNSPKGRGILRSRGNSPVRGGKKEQAGNDQKQQDLSDSMQEVHQMYCYSELGRTFVKAIGQTEQIKNNLSNLISDMDDHVTVGFSKTKTNNRDMEDLLSTKDRIVNILEDIIEKEYTTPQDMASMINENWDIIEEYERQIADMLKEFQREKDLVKQRYENRIFSLKENFTFEITHLEQEIANLKTTLATKEEDFTNELTERNTQIELLMQRIAGLEAPSDRDDIETVKSRVVQSRSQKRSKSSMQKTNLVVSKKTDKNDDKKSVASGSLKKSKLGREASKNHLSVTSGTKKKRGSRIPDEAIMNNDSILTQDLAEGTSIYEDRKGSRTSVSSRGVSVQQFMIPSKNIDELEMDDKSKVRKLKAFFLRLYEKVLFRKGIASLSSYNSLESGCSDDEGGSEDWNLDIYDQLAKQMTDHELCEAAGVKPIDLESATVRERRISAARKKIPGLLFQRRKKGNFNFEIIPEIKEEPKDERATSMLLNDVEEPKSFEIFEKNKENLFNFIEAVTNQSLAPETKELAIPKLFVEEISLSIDRMLTIGDFQEYLREPISEVVVTVEQLMINVMNFYLSLLHEKGDIVRFYSLGKRISEKKYNTVQVDTSDLPKPVEPKTVEKPAFIEIVKIDQETQTSHNLYLDLRSTDTPSRFSLPKSNQQSPMKALQDSLDSWKNRLTHSKANEIIYSSEKLNTNIAQDLKNLLTSKKQGTVLGINSRMMENRLRRKLRPNTSSNIIEKDQESVSTPTGASPYQNSFLFGYDRSNADLNLQEGRSIWKNILAEQLFPQAVQLTSERFLEGEPSQHGLSKQSYGQNVPVTYLQMPQRVNSLPKREEVRQRINQEKKRFTSYKEEQEERGQSRASQRVFEETNYVRPQGRWVQRPGSQHSNEVHELCKRTVMALYDYIGSVQKEMVNPSKLKIDLKDVNRKVTEIEEMLQTGQMDPKYSSLTRYYQNRGSTPGYQNTDNKRRGLDRKMQETGESWKVNPLNDTASKRKDTGNAEVKKTKIEDVLTDPDHFIEGFTKDDHEYPSRIGWDEISANLDFKGVASYSNQVKFEEKEKLKDINEFDGKGSLNDSGSLENEDGVKKSNPAKRANTTGKKPPLRSNTLSKTAAEGPSRMDILSKLGPSESSKNSVALRVKIDKDNKERDYRDLKKAAFKVKRVSASRERVAQALNNSII